MQMVNNKNTIQMTPQEKAKELVNMYYSHAKTQAEALQMVDNILLGTLCERIDSLHGHVFFRKDFDIALIESAIQQLKWWQEVAYEIQQLRINLQV